MTCSPKVKTAVKSVLGLVLFVILIFAGFLAWQTLKEYNPLPVEAIQVAGTPDSVPDTLMLTTFNVGYCGLGAEMDFFYEGGKMARPTEELLNRYQQGMLQRLKSFSKSDFILIQEVDTCAKRSWYSNQLNMIRSEMPEYETFFAMNYKAWVPMPVTNPMGKVRAGLVSLSKYTPAQAERNSFNSGYSWPMSLFMLKRCFLVKRFPTRNGAELVLVNTHNSAFSDAAEIREKELAQLRQLMDDEAKKGNYVIIGGDWNQNPVGFDTTQLLAQYLPKVIEPPIPGDFLPQGWSFAYDPLHSTNRNVEIPYTSGVTLTTLIDFFVVSPNIEVLTTQTTDIGFAESDHQPVTLRVVLRKP